MPGLARRLLGKSKILNIKTILLLTQNGVWREKNDRQIDRLQ